MPADVKTNLVKSREEFIPTRVSLINRLKDWRDNDSWDEFFKIYWKLIYSVASKAGLSEVEAQEVVQETIINVSKQMPSFKYDPAIGSFKGWLMRQTHWRIMDQFRKRQREANAFGPRTEGGRRTSTLEQIPDPASFNLDAVWEEEWRKNLMEAAIVRVKQQVNAKQYQIFDLYVIKKWPLEKITAALDLSDGQVYLAKHRISALIKKEIKTLETRVT